MKTHLLGHQSNSPIALHGRVSEHQCKFRESHPGWHRRQYLARQSSAGAQPSAEHHHNLGADCAYRPEASGRQETHPFRPVLQQSRTSGPRAMTGHGSQLTSPSSHPAHQRCPATPSPFCFVSAPSSSVARWRTSLPMPSLASCYCSTARTPRSQSSCSSTLQVRAFTT